MQTAAEQTQQTNDDKIDRDDIVQQTRLNQDENACEQRDDRSKADLHIHVDVSCARPGMPANAEIITFCACETRYVGAHRRARLTTRHPFRTQNVRIASPGAAPCPWENRNVSAAYR